MKEISMKERISLNLNFNERNFNERHFNERKMMKMKMNLNERKMMKERWNFSERRVWLEGERILSMLHTQHGVQYGAQFHNPEVMTWAKIKSQTLNHLSRGAPLMTYFWVRTVQRTNGYLGYDRKQKLRFDIILFRTCSKLLRICKLPCYLSLPCLQ